jgi:hypothetical protein
MPAFIAQALAKTSLGACLFAEDRERRRKVGVPEDVKFKTKPEIALEQLRWAHQAGLQLSKEARRFAAALVVSPAASHPAVGGVVARPFKMWRHHVKLPDRRISFQGDVSDGCCEH